MSKRFSPVALLLFACGGTTSTSSPSSATNTTEAWNDTEMQALVATKCATSSCHGGAQAPTFTNMSEEDMRAFTQALVEVRAGRMPRNGSLTEAERAVFVAFYEGDGTGQ